MYEVVCLATLSNVFFGVAVMSVELEVTAPLNPGFTVYDLFDSDKVT